MDKKEEIRLLKIAIEAAETRIRLEQLTIDSAEAKIKYLEKQLQKE